MGSKNSGAVFNWEALSPWKGGLDVYSTGDQDKESAGRLLGG